MKADIKEKIANVADKFLGPYNKGFSLNDSICGSITPEEGEYMHDFIIEHKLKTGIEIGTGPGYSGLYLGSALEALSTVDNGLIARTINMSYDEIKNIWQAMYADMGFRPGKVMFETKIEDCLLSEVDFVLIDGDHNCDSPFYDFMTVRPFLAKKHYIFWHDTGIVAVSESIKKSNYRNRKDIELDNTYGLAVTSK